MRVPDAFAPATAELVLRLTSDATGVLSAGLPVRDLPEDTPTVQETMVAADNHLRCGRRSEALATLERGLDAHAAHPYLLNHLAWMLLTSSPPSAEEAARALQLAQQALEALDGNEDAGVHAAVLHTLAVALDKNGKRKAALRRAEQALALLPDHPRLRQTVESLRNSGDAAGDTPADAAPEGRSTGEEEWD
ncbi:MAG: hypothetical protein ACOCX4_01860 [Planctomycetota bacterium]